MSNTPRQSESLGSLAPVVEDALKRLGREQAVRRIWDKDASLWKQEEAHQKVIRNALGWLTVARQMRANVNELASFTNEVRDARFTHLMLLGMGGSSLCPEVLRRTFGKREGYPELLVLDTTDPDTIFSFEQSIDLARTLFIVSSKSGTTIEPLSFYKYFFERVRTVKGERAGENFVAITDPGTLMERMATAAGFRRIFLNPPDIGGRYSALSYFGIVPAALMGLDATELLERAAQAMDACAASVPTAENPGARLGCVMGALFGEGRDKLTLVTGGRIASLGLWIEQLIAESTGKEGKGIVPVSGEPLGAADNYGHDRLFVSIRAGEIDEETEVKLRALEAAGHPVVRRVLDDPLDLTAEFFIWEMATAVAGALMGINPFDQPNVQESKDNTNRLLEEFKSSGELPQATALLTEGELKIYAPKRSAEDLSAPSAPRTEGDGQQAEAGSPEKPAQTPLTAIIAEHLASARPGDYVALLAYIQERDEHDELLQAIRTRVRDALRVATTTGYGPRYLHSTGQLHKGGADNGVFIQITDEDRTDLTVPGEAYTFGVLKQAQALGDFSSLASHNRRALRFHLGRDTEAGLHQLLKIISAATSRANAQSRSVQI